MKNKDNKGPSLLLLILKGIVIILFLGVVFFGITMLSMFLINK